MSLDLFRNKAAFVEAASGRRTKSVWGTAALCHPPYSVLSEISGSCLVLLSVE